MKPDARTRFWAKVEKVGDGCWEWCGTKDRKGYGAFRPVGSGAMVKVHRFAYEDLVGPIPDGLVIDHLCRNPGCVNPAHLEPVTQRENMRRTRRASCDCGQPLEMYGGYRTCRACRRKYLTEYQRARRARLRAQRQEAVR